MLVKHKCHGYPPGYLQAQEWLDFLQQWGWSRLQKLSLEGPVVVRIIMLILGWILGGIYISVIYGLYYSIFQRVLFDSKGWCIGTPYHPFSTLWKIQVYIYRILGIDIEILIFRGFEFFLF